jgi:hypothetical protein
MGGNMKINKSEVKSQKILVLLITFGVMWGLNAGNVLKGRSSSEGLFMREAFASHMTTDLHGTLTAKRDKPSGEVNLGQAFINAFESNDESEMKRLVRENKGSVSKELIDMITYATSGEVSSEEMTWLIRITDKMAALYHNEFSDKRLESFVSNYKKWSQKEQKRKKEADNIFYSYKMEMKNRNYDAVVEMGPVPGYVQGDRR